jgi:hypothetical protein
VIKEATTLAPQGVPRVPACPPGGLAADTR